MASDAGTPGISDPVSGYRCGGRRRVGGHECARTGGGDRRPRRQWIAQQPIRSEGFLARKGQERLAQLAAIGCADTHDRLLRVAQPFGRNVGRSGGACGGSRRAVVARELTSCTRSLWLARRAAEWAAVKGEVVVVVAGAKHPPNSTTTRPSSGCASRRVESAMRSMRRC